MLGKDVVLIINPTNENLDRMRLFQEKDIYEIIEKIYKGKDILLSNWEKADYMTEDRQYLIFMPFLDTEKLHRLNIFYIMPFLDTEKLHRLNIFYKNNKESYRKIDILTLKENVKKTDGILVNKTNIIEIDKLI